LTTAVTDLHPGRTTQGRPTLSPLVHEIVILCLELAAVVAIAAGLGIAAFELVRWPGFLVMAGAVLLAAGWLGDWLGGRAGATQPAPPGRPPVTRSKDIPQVPSVIVRTWWRFAWLAKE